MWANDEIKLKKPTATSSIIKRANGTLDKAIFRNNYEKGDMFMMLDLLNGFEHGGNNSLAVTTIVKNGINRIYDIAHRDEANESKPIVRANMENFPRETSYNEDWQFVSIEFEKYWSWGNYPMEDYRYHTAYDLAGNDLHLTNDYKYNPQNQFVIGFPNWAKFKGETEIYIKELKLFDINGDVLLQDDMQNWNGNVKKEEDYLIFNISNNDNKVHFGKIFNSSLDIHTKPRLEFYIKIKNQEKSLILKNMLITVGDKTCYPHNYLMFHNPMFGVKARYFEDDKKVTLASFYIDEKDSLGRRIQRERSIIFVKNMLIWVRDKISLIDKGHFVCGPVWRFDKIQKIDENKFLTTTDGDMITYLLPRDDYKIQVKEDIVVPEKNTRILYQYFQGEAENKILYFDTLLIPTDREEKYNICVNYDDIIHTNITVNEITLEFNENNGKFYE
jgi:hypothetical protein